VVLLEHKLLDMTFMVLMLWLLTNLKKKV